MASALKHAPTLDRVRHQVEVFDDFTWYITAHNFTTTATDSGTVSVGDGVKGVVALVPSDGTVANNDEAYIKTSTELFKFANGKKLYGAAEIQFTEGNTDDVNIFAGFADAIGANTLVDDGAGLKTSFSGACIYKVDGGTVWKCVSSNGATQTISTSGTTAGGASYQLLEIIAEDHDSTQCKVLFKVDGKYLRDTNNVIIKHYVAYTSATEMQFGAGIKNGADTTLEQLNIDWLYAAQVK